MSQKGIHRRVGHGQGKLSKNTIYCIKLCVCVVNYHGSQSLLQS